MADTPEGVLRCGRCEWKIGLYTYPDADIGLREAHGHLRRHWQREHAPPKVSIDREFPWDVRVLRKGQQLCRVTFFPPLLGESPSSPAEVAQRVAEQAGYEVQD